MMQKECTILHNVHALASLDCQMAIWLYHMCNTTGPADVVERLLWVALSLSPCLYKTSSVRTTTACAELSTNDSNLLLHVGSNPTTTTRQTPSEHRKQETSLINFAKRRYRYDPYTLFSPGA